MPGRTYNRIGVGMTHVAAVGLEFSATIHASHPWSTGLTGQLTGDIAQLSELQMLDLAYNNGLTGTLTPSIGSLTKLTYLSLVGCGFSGPIPDTIGSLQQLHHLDLNSNSFSGSIPPSIGSLSNLYWLDLSNNTLSGTIPVSSGTTPGLDMLVNTLHLHLDGNSLTGSVPSQFDNLTRINVLYLSNNQLSGPIPNLSTMKSLNYVDTYWTNDLMNQLLLCWLSKMPGRTYHRIGVGLTHVAAVGLEFSATIHASHPWSTGLTGQLTGDIAQLSELQMLDLSYNKGLTGALTPSIRSLTKLTNLILIGCDFSGPIPDTIGSLQQLYYLDLNSNRFSGSIPPSIGNLSNLYWLDLSNNTLSGTIPVSSGTTPVAYLYNNIKKEAFYRGKEVSYRRLDGNSLTGSVPSQFNNLTSINVLYLSNNQLSGPIPNLSTMKSLTTYDCIFLHMVFDGNVTCRDLSNNTFDASVFPSWLSNLLSLTTIVMENTRLYGSLPSALFNLPQFPQLQTVTLSNNNLNGTLDAGFSYSSQLKLVDLQNNSISAFTQRAGSTIEFILAGNPICTGTGGSNTYCVTLQSNSSSYSTLHNNCIPSTCNSPQVSSPNCSCAYPYTGTLKLRAPSFSDLGNSTMYKTLESSLMDCFQSNQLPADSVSLSSPTKTTDNNLLIILEVFPYGQDHFNQTGIFGIAFVLSNHTFQTPSTYYGPYSFRGYGYYYFAEGNKSLNRGVITGAAVGGTVVLLLALLAGFYAFSQKRRAEKADRVNNPFASWNPNTTSGGVPLLQGAKCFSFDDLKKYTNNFAEANSIGSGGYGKVYRGTLPNGQLIAIKRAQRGSLQGGLEFKTEIELLSRRMKRDQVIYSLDEILDPVILGPTLKGLEQFVDLAMRCVEEEGARRPAMGAVVKEIENVMQIAGLNPNADSTSTSATHEGDGKGNHPKPIQHGKNIVREVKEAMDEAKDPSELLEILDPKMGWGTGHVIGSLSMILLMEISFGTVLVLSFDH
ncbi:hypothetical protein C3L33_21338, partial [Rhododendron williamsianum]